MNILLINHYAGTPALGMEYRPHSLAREWVRLKHRVMIVGASFSHVRTRQPAPGNESIDGIHYRWLPTPPYAGNGFGRVKNILAFLSQLSAQAQGIVQGFKPDAVISSSTYPMDHWIARRIGRAAGARLVHEIHDLWPLSPIELSGMSPWHPFALICQSAEDAAYRHSDAIVSMLPKVHEHVARRGGDPKKITLVPQGVNPEDWKAANEPLRQDIAQAIAAHHAAGATVVAYTGAMGEPNALDTLLDAARMLVDKPLRFVLVGSGHERERIERRITGEGLAQVQCFAPVPKAQMPALLEAADIAYLGWQPKPIYRFGIAPNKLIDYMMAGKPVLHSVTAGNDPVAEAGCGLSVPAGSAEEVAKGLRQLAALRPKDRRVLGERGRAYVLKHHAWPHLAQRFLTVLDKPR